METALLHLLVSQGLELLAIHDLVLFVLVACGVVVGLTLRDLARVLATWVQTRHRGHGHNASRVQAAPPSGSVAAMPAPEGVPHRASGAVTDADVSDADWQCWCEQNADNYRRYHA